jgi:hypothetical protein
VFCYILYHAHVLCFHLGLRCCKAPRIFQTSPRSKCSFPSYSRLTKTTGPCNPSRLRSSLRASSWRLSISASSALNDTKGPLWDMVVAIVQHYLQPGMFILKFACYGTDMHHFIGRFSCGT